MMETREGSRAMESGERMPITKKGYEKLLNELNYLKRVERPKNVQAIELARSNGDLSENADYDAAKEHQARIARRIGEIENKLAMSEVIDIAKMVGNSRIMFGATVTLMDTATEKEVTYKIVGVDEADLKENTISVQSPLGQAMIGKEEGDTIEVKSPAGVREYGIVRVQYIE